jgi:hypothetical protein
MSKNEFPQTDFNSAVPPQKTINQKKPIAIVDAGATGHCLDPAAEPRCSKVHHANSGPSTQVLANGENIETTKQAALPLAKELSKKPKSATFSMASPPALSSPLANCGTTIALPCLPNSTSRSSKMENVSF